MKKKTIIWAAVAVVALIAIGFWLFGGSSETQKIHIATAPVTRGDVSTSITATGTIEPVTEVEVGTQVSGIIDKIYVDYNSEVKKGQLIAEMDKITLMSDLQSSQANYNGQKANFEYQEKTYNRNKALHEKQLISDTEFEQSEYSYMSAKAQYEQSRANLAKAQRNLSYATIYSPIDGVVINKAVEEGQTVAAGFNTPTLFNIAADLTQMRVVADVDEADIGGIEEGLRATFTVDAYPDDVFEGTVVQVRLGEKSSSTTSSSVVTYEVVINAPNNDLKLKPRLTANVTIYKQEHKNVTLVPSRALRFFPTPAIGATQINDVDAPQKVWTKEGNVYTAHAVTVGLTGNSMTEVEGVTEGMQVVTDATSTERANGMMERMPGMGGGPGGGGPGGGGPGGGGPGGPM